MAKMSVYDVITDCIIKRLEAGVVPWHRPWKTFGQPKTLISNEKYRRINHFLLGCVNFTSSYFLTFKHSKQFGGHVHKGERSLPCLSMDSKLVVIAAAPAQKAADFILGKGGRDHE